MQHNERTANYEQFIYHIIHTLLTHPPRKVFKEGEEAGLSHSVNGRGRCYLGEGQQQNESNPSYEPFIYLGGCVNGLSRWEGKDSG